MSDEDEDLAWSLHHPMLFLDSLTILLHLTQLIERLFQPKQGCWLLE